MAEEDTGISHGVNTVNIRHFRPPSLPTSQAGNGDSWEDSFTQAWALMGLSALGHCVGTQKQNRGARTDHKGQGIRAQCLLGPVVHTVLPVTQD